MLEFDELVKLNQTDPDKFEQERSKLISEFLDSIDNEDLKLKLERMQWRLDQKRKLLTSGQYMNLLYDEMLESLNKLNDFLQGALE